jgi:hypothetical protein
MNSINYNKYFNAFKALNSKPKILNSDMKKLLKNDRLQLEISRLFPS